MNFLFKTVVYLNRKGERKTTGEIMLALLMAVVMMLFLPLIIVLLRNRQAAHLSLPKEFALSTLLLIGATWLLQYVRQYKENDKYKQLRRAAFIQLALTFLFLLIQFWGTRKIFSLAQYSQVKIIALVVIYHALHLCVVMSIHLKLLLKTRSIHSAADWYIYFLNPKHHFAFKHNLLFWNFCCLLWVSLYVLMILKFG